MRVDPSTQRHIDDHLQRAEFSLRVVANFQCLENTPALAQVRKALAQTGETREWVKSKLIVATPYPLRAGPLPDAARLLRRRRMGI